MGARHGPIAIKYLTAAIPALHEVPVAASRLTALSQDQDILSFPPDIYSIVAISTRWQCVGIPRTSPSAPPDRGFVEPLKEDKRLEEL